MDFYCEPKIIGAEKEFEGYDEDGKMEVSTNFIYNCEGCEYQECINWKDYN